MLSQIFLGSVITLASLIFAALLWWWLNEILRKLEVWLATPPLVFKSMVLIMLVVTWAMAMMTFGVWMWAIVFMALDVFSGLEEAVYYSLVAYTTLGLGDVIVPFDHRLLGGMTGANGFLMFGLLTAMLTDPLRHIRKVQHHIED